MSGGRLRDRKVCGFARSSSRVRVPKALNERRREAQKEPGK